MSKFNPAIKYQLGTQGCLPNALTKSNQDLPEEGDQQLDYRMSQLISDDMIQETTLWLAPVVTAPTTIGNSFIDLLKVQCEEVKDQDKDFEWLTAVA